MKDLIKDVKERLKELNDKGIPVHIVANQDLVSVVRCKDCKHFRVMEGERLCGAWEEIFYNPVDENGYCYKGVRKDEVERWT